MIDLVIGPTDVQESGSMPILCKAPYCRQPEIGNVRFQPAAYVKNNRQAVTVKACVTIEARMLRVWR
jgi:hypothetical protein